jgi:periplasmic protein TonB
MYDEHSVDPRLLASSTQRITYWTTYGTTPAAAGLLSLGIHLLGFFLVWLLFLMVRSGTLDPALNRIHGPISLEKLVWRIPAPAGGGGGGGDHAATQVSLGAAPPSARKVFIAPTLVTNPDAKLQVAPALLDADAPKIQADQYGDPLGKSGLLSAGPGANGLGKGVHGGEGPGDGPGYGPGAKGGMHGPYSLGQVSTLPVLLIKVEPEYSEQARQAKFQGTVLLRVIVDEKGLPRQILVIRPLGMQLDEKAIEAVQHWRFKPATKDGKAVAVEATVEVNFRLL